MIDAPSLYLIQDFAILLLAAVLAAFLCKRINLSPVVGYLLAGVIIGTPQITFVQVTDPQRVHLLSQLGLIFLMFSIGLGFRVQRFKQLGGGMIIACLTTALIMLTFTRMAGGWLGLDQGSALFFAAMLMVSSSAVIGKSLQSQGLTHRRFGQLAMGITLCEDIVAIVLLAFLGSYAAFDPNVASKSNMFAQVGGLLAFVVLLLLPGLLIVPKILRSISRYSHDSEEMQTVFVCALLFSMAVVTLVSGYSLALGSFLCGVLVAESTRGKQVAESFSGLKDLFVAVFFVAIGMNVDITRFPDSFGLILLGTGIALILRPLAAQLGLLIACEDPEDAAKAGLCLAPIGEFSFVIANLGVGAGILGQEFQVAAVGIAFNTAIISPWVIQRSDSIARRISPSGSRWLDRGLDAYRRMWRLIDQRQNASIIWKLLRPRIPQVTTELLFVSAILVFSQPIYEALGPTFAKADPTLEETYRIGYWVLVAILVLAPLLALARNINAIAMLLGESLTQGLPHASTLRGGLILLLRGLSLLGLGIWITNLIPFAWLGLYGLVAVAIAVLLCLVFGWRSLVRIHSEAAFSLSEAVTKDSPAEAEVRLLHKAKEDWGISLEELTVNSPTQVGRSISELQIRKNTGTTIVGIERQGHYLPTIGPATHLFTGDRLYATGTPEGLQKLRHLLSRESEFDVDGMPDYSSAILESATVNAGSDCAGQSLRSLRWPRLQGVQVVALRRGKEAPRPPDVDEKLQVGDSLLLVGAPRALLSIQVQLERPTV